PAPEFSPVAEEGGLGGYGAVGVAGHLLAGRADSGTAGSAVTDGPRSWQQSQMLYTGAPAAVAETSGTAVAAVLGLDAELHLVSEAPPTERRGSRSSSPWHRAVPPRPHAQDGSADRTVAGGPPLR
ncbi:hypothetical protein ACFXJJ_36840, partial [Streptomyces sp. NPDC059233]